jgi:hypothetical protein
MSASCPVIVGDKVFLTAPVASEQKLVGLCYDANSGKELWRKAISDGLRWDDRSNMANPSPTADSERVVFLFSNAQLAAYSHTGDELWKRDLTETHGAFGTQWTYGSSPLLDNGKLYIQVLQRNDTFEFQGFQKGTPGKDMASSHKDRGITNREFNALVENLQLAMNTEGVPFRAQNKLLAKLTPMQRDVVTR